VKIVHAILVLVLPTAIYFFMVWLEDLMDVDACLDAGGGWNRETSSREGSPAYDRWRERYPRRFK
jgi:hypothetical protein